RLPLEGNGPRGPVCHDDVGLQADQLVREPRYPIAVIAEPPKLHPQVATIGPTQVRKHLHERREATLLFGIVFVVRHEHADAPHPLALLRLRRERPSCRAAEERDRLATIDARDHSITSSASARTRGGISKFIAFAALRLITSSNLVAWKTGRSAGF